MSENKTSPRSLEALKANPNAIGIMKGYSPKEKFGHDDLEENNGMFLGWLPSANSVTFLYRDLSYEKACEIGGSFKHFMFVPYDILDESQLEYINAWRKKDEVCAKLPKKLNTINYSKIDTELKQQMDAAGPDDDVEAVFVLWKSFNGSKDIDRSNITRVVKKILKEVESEVGAGAKEFNVLHDLRSFVVRAPVSFVRALVKHDGIKCAMANTAIHNENNQ